MMLLDALALGAVGIASDILEDTSILPQEYVKPQSLGEEVRSQLLMRYVPACLPEDGAQGAGIELLVARNRQTTKPKPSRIRITADPERRRRSGMHRLQLHRDHERGIRASPVSVRSSPSR